MRQSIKVNKVSITLNKCRYLKLLSLPSSLALFVAGTIKYAILINKKETKKSIWSERRSPITDKTTPMRPRTATFKNNFGKIALRKGPACSSEYTLKIVGAFKAA
jgi:hypothetical protein